MTAIAFDAAETEAPPRRPAGLAWWIAASVLVHVALIVWMLIQIVPELVTLGAQSSQDHRPIEMVKLQAPPATAHSETPSAVADQPRLELPPVHRAVQPKMQTMDSATMMKLLHQQATSQDNTQDGGAGFSWTTCSLMTPEQRAMMPGCDGMMLQHHAGTGVAVSLEAPDGATLALVKKYEKEAEQKLLTGPGHTDDKNADKSYRDPSDDRYGKKPWE